MAQDLQHLLDFGVPPEHGRQLVLAREQVHVGGEVFQERGELETLLQPLVAQFHVAYPRVQARHQHVWFDAVSSQDGHRNALRFLEDRREEIGRLDRLPPRTAGLVQCKFEDELRGR